MILLVGLYRDSSPVVIQRQRLAKHGRGVEATFLGTPCFWPLVAA